jgi:diguanylate cyclase (GGDEF)-like protein
MVPPAITETARYEFALEAPPRVRALRARAQLALKRFVLGAPEDELVTMARPRRGVAHLAIVALLTLPLALIEVARSDSGTLARTALLLTVLAGVTLAARLESVHERPRPIVDLMGALLLALSIAGLLLLAARAALPFVEARHALALVVLPLAALSVRGDPRACAFAAGLGALALIAFASHRGEAALLALAPDLASVGAAGTAATFAAQRRRSLARLAIRDPASGALHEAAFASCLAAAGERARDMQRPLSIARIEIASLHLIRQTHGEAFAGALTRWLARLISDRFRTTDLLGRVHADAFAMALVDADHPTVARRFEQLRDELSTIALVKDGQREPIALALAVGIAAVPREALEVGEALKLAQTRASLARWRTQQAALTP